MNIYQYFYYFFGENILVFLGKDENDKRAKSPLNDILNFLTCNMIEKLINNNRQYIPTKKKKAIY
jgi:hypothetical protein